MEYCTRSVRRRAAKSKRRNRTSPVDPDAQQSGSVARCDHDFFLARGGERIFGANSALVPAIAANKVSRLGSLPSAFKARQLHKTPHLRVGCFPTSRELRRWAFDSWRLSNLFRRQVDSHEVFLGLKLNPAA